MTAKGEFQGFPKEMFEFFMAISFNNNTEFFEENRKLYEQKVKAPLYALARDLTPMALHVDPEMEVRPSKVVSRLRRDTRFSANKLPYRDHMWLSWRPAGRPKSQCFGLYLEIGLEGLRYGVGWYDADPRRAKAIRRLLRQQEHDGRHQGDEPIAHGQGQQLVNRGVQAFTRLSIRGRGI